MQCPSPPSIPAALRRVVLVLLLGWAPALHAQEAVRRLETGFERDVNRYRWVAHGSVTQPFGSWALRLRNRFTSDAFLLFDDRLSFRDENQLAWELGRPLGGSFDTSVRGRAAWFSQSRVFSQELYSALRYRPSSHLWLEPAIGLAWDRRPGIGEGDVSPLRLDAGPAYGMRIGWAPPELGGYRLRLDADGAWQVITPRRGRALRASGLAARSFENLRMEADLGLSSYRRDAYQAVSFLNRGVPTGRLSETVEATTSDTLQARVRVEAPLPRGFLVTTALNVGANNRGIRTLRAPGEALIFDTDFIRRAIEAEAGIGYERARTLFHVAVRGGAETEDRRITNREDLSPAQVAQKTTLLEQADYDQGHLEVQARGRLARGRTTLLFDGTSSIVRRDTPESNLDDRDELYHNVQTGALVALSRYLEVDVKLYGSYYHTVYLKAARSGENNTQRSLRMRPSIRWRPSPRTELQLSPELRATYTVDDYTLPGRRASDQSARELRYDGRLEHDLGAGLILRASGSYSELQLGRLLWPRFAEIPYDTLRTYSGWVRLQAGRRVTAEVGLRFFIRSDFNRATQVRYARLDETGAVVRRDDGEIVRSSITRPGREWITQIGPTCALSVPALGGSTFRLEGWLNGQHVHQRLYGELPEATADRIQEAARAGTRRIFPNVSMAILWDL